MGQAMEHIFQDTFDDNAVSTPDTHLRTWAHNEAKSLPKGDKWTPQDHVRWSSSFKRLYNAAGAKLKVLVLKPKRQPPSFNELLVALTRRCVYEQSVYWIEGQYSDNDSMLTIYIVQHCL
jgi:hypothetical protein